MCARIAKAVHNTGCLPIELVVTYPFHPFAGQLVPIVGHIEHAGTRHLITRSAFSLGSPTASTVPGARTSAPCRRARRRDQNRQRVACTVAEWRALSLDKHTANLFQRFCARRREIPSMRLLCRCPLSRANERPRVAPVWKALQNGPRDG